MAMNDRTHSSARVAISNGLAGVGVLLFVSASVSPAAWYPIVQLFAGLVSIAISHVLTPCRNQLTHWWTARISKPSLDGGTGASLPSNPTAERDARKSGI